MKTRIGHIQFLNSLPLYHMLVKEEIILGIDLFKDSPRQLCRRLLDGQLDISPVPAIEYARHADQLFLLPDLTISSDGKVMSILLVSKVPIEQLDGKRVALTNTSATSQVLARIILEEKYGLCPDYFECPPDLGQMFREAEAALLIGDEALRVLHRPIDYHLYDLGEEWTAFTGEKMVYAVWCVRRAYALENREHVDNVSHAFQHSMEMSKEYVDLIAEEAARWDVFSKNFLKEYFTSLKFEFGQDYQQGLLVYLNKAKELGALEDVPELTFFRNSAAKKDCMK
ncbi:MAG: menaquinone biosynthesis protein [Proteobacteria bacterium]|nr:menaquinone biosynthesis protein [Pseudomonadota bacterium]MBU1419852.1 menaquinone biosynthesis protein [Pseudomonadota bacterium]MBU1454625.1 menaquinone biosynthesis protein [Pseudomonadota bacterium]